MTQHKWHKEIKAWADGAEIENRHRDENGNWCEWGYWSSNADVTVNFLTHDGIEYRIKPQPKPDAFVGAFVYKLATGEIKLFDSFQHGEKLLGVTKIKLEQE